MKVGFTATRDGITLKQSWRVRDWLADHEPIEEVHHGCCVGGDADLQTVVIRGRVGETDERMYAVLHAHPSNLPGMTDAGAQALADVVHSPLPPLERNHVIVDISHALLACPKGPEELRSGTWATVRYCRKVGKPVWIFYPDGSIQEPTKEQQ